MRDAAFCLALYWCTLSAAVAGESILLNPTKRAYTDELVRLKTPAPGAAGTFIVKQDGAEITYQVEEIGGKQWIRVCSSFEPGASHKYEVVSGQPKAAQPRVAVRRDGNCYVLDNSLAAVKVPADGQAGMPDLPGPVVGVKLGDKWVGGSFWHTSSPLKKFTATVVGDGTILGKVRLRYEFDGLAGIDGNVPAFAQFDVSLGPGWSHVEIFERHEMARDDYWELEASKGWSPRQGVSKAFSGGAGSGLVGGKVDPQRDLKPGGLPYQQPDLFINLFPRWNQHYKDGWYFAATDGTSYVGAVVGGAGRWVWPHSNSVQAVVKDSGDYAGLRGSTWKGQRLWWLFAPTLAACNVEYVARYSWESLDKLNHDFILDWPGQPAVPAARGSF
ncbi:MAG: hypothetical protein NTW87_34545, partial [Planctomycetota bacterium]|nr:hypothetical protein [Planctomycetota bacterium]